MKTLASFAFALMATAIVVVPAGAAAPRKKVVRRAPAAVAKPVIWERRVVRTADGGFLVGNPAAKVRLIEYGSLTCPYCQKFHQSAIAGIRARVATGQVAFEFQPFAVHSADPILHALLRCAGPTNFLRFSDDFYEGQETLAAAYEAWATANPNVDPYTSPADRIRYAREWGFTAFARTHGLTAAKATACLNDNATLRLQQQREDPANGGRSIPGTPTFFLNDTKLEVYTWPEIDAAIGGALAAD